MALPTIGDGEQIGDGNTGETLVVGRSNQPVQLGNGTGGVRLGSTASSKVGFYGTTPIVRGAAVTTLATTPTATDIATAVNSIISRLQAYGLLA